MRRSYRKVLILALVVAGGVAITLIDPTIGADALQVIGASAAAVVAVNASEHSGGGAEGGAGGVAAAPDTPPAPPAAPGLQPIRSDK